jgi:transposase
MVKLEEFMEIFRLKENGYSLSAISRMTGSDRKTVRKYLNKGKSKIPVMKPRKSKASKLQSFEKEILNLIKYSDLDFPPCPAIYERLVEKGYTGSLSLLQKWMSTYRQQHIPKVIIRYETPPGQQAQVDWGEKKIRDRRTGLVKKVYIFSMVLCWSRMRFACFVPKADMYYFLLCHKLAFKYLGGVPREILYDQNKCVLIKPGFKDIAFNRKFLDFAHHYDFVPRVCKPYRAQTKGKVENNIKYIKRNFLSLQDTHDLKDLNQRVKPWLEKVNHKVHSTIQEIPYKRLPKETLKLLDGMPDYDLFYFEPRKVFNDSTFSFHSKRYSVPPLYIGKTITVKYRPNQSSIDVYFKDERITQHRTDTWEQYVIKRSHSHEIWKVWRDDKKRFYQQHQKDKQANHPLALYEQISLLEEAHECPTA